MEQKISKIKEIIHQLPVRMDLARVVIDDINDETKGLIDALWDSRVQFIVASDNPVALGEVNNKVVNRSGSMGRWKVVNYAQTLREPCELFIAYKSKEASSFSNQTIRYQEIG